MNISLLLYGLTPLVRTWTWNRTIRMHYVFTCCCTATHGRAEDPRSFDSKKPLNERTNWNGHACQDTTRLQIEDERIQYLLPLLAFSCRLHWLVVGTTGSCRHYWLLWALLAPPRKQLLCALWSDVYNQGSLYWIQGLVLPRCGWEAKKGGAPPESLVGVSPQHQSPTPRDRLHMLMPSAAIRNEDLSPSPFSTRLQEVQGMLAKFSRDRRVGGQDELVASIAIDMRENGSQRWNNVGSRSRWWPLLIRLHRP